MNGISNNVQKNIASNYLQKNWSARIFIDLNFLKIYLKPGRRRHCPLIVCYERGNFSILFIQLLEHSNDIIDVRIRLILVLPSGNQSIRP